MGYAIQTSPEKTRRRTSSSSEKNASGDFFENPNKMRLENRCNPLKTRQENQPTPTKIALGVHFKNYLDHVYAVSDTDGDLIEHYRYSAFGEIEVYSPTGTKLTDSAIENTVTWNSRRYDFETELYYYKYRHYKADYGRWLGRDPIEEKAGQDNLYAFTYNSPFDWWDKLGLIGFGCKSKCTNGAKELLDVKFAFHGAGNMGRLNNPDQQNAVINGLAEIADAMDFKPRGIPGGNIIGVFTDIQEEMAEAIVRAIPNILENNNNRLGYVMWYKVVARCCDKKELCCQFSWEFLRYRWNWREVESEWKLYEAPKADRADGKLGADKGVLFKALPGLVAKEMLTICDNGGGDGDD